MTDNQPNQSLSTQVVQQPRNQRMEVHYGWGDIQQPMNVVQQTQFSLSSTAQPGLRNELHYGWGERPTESLFMIDAPYTSPTMLLLIPPSKDLQTASIIQQQPATFVSTVQVQRTLPPQKGESRTEQYIPQVFQDKYIEYVPVERVQERIVYDKFVEYVPQERVKERIEYQEVERQVMKENELNTQEQEIIPSYVFNQNQIQEAQQILEKSFCKIQEVSMNMEDDQNISMKMQDDQNVPPVIQQPLDQIPRIEQDTGSARSQILEQYHECNHDCRQEPNRTQRRSSSQFFVQKTVEKSGNVQNSQILSSSKLQQSISFSQSLRAHLTRPSQTYESQGDGFKTNDSKLIQKYIEFNKFI